MGFVKRKKIFVTILCSSRITLQKPNKNTYGFVFIFLLLRPMNEFIINFLKKVQAYLEESSLDDSPMKKTDTPSQKNGKFVRRVVLLLSTLWYIGVMMTLFDTYFLHNNFWNDTIPYYLHIFILIFILIQSLLFVFTIERIRANDCKILSYLYLIYFPLYFSSIGMYLFFMKRSSFEENSFNIILISLLSVYPLFHIVSSLCKREINTLWEKIKNMFLYFNLWFFFLLSVNILLVSFGYEISLVNPWTDLIIKLTSMRHSYSFIEGMFYILACFFFLTSWVFSLNTYFAEVQKKRKKLHIWLFLIIWVFILTLAPSLLDSFYDLQIKRASEILTREGQNSTGYAHAQVFWLKRAFYSKIKNHEYIDLTLFKKIFDSTPEELYGEDIADYTDSRSSFGTNASKVGDASNVILSLAEIENRISSGSLFQVLETTYRWSFTNTSRTSQEVILNFETPTKHSVVSSLSLWLDLELIGQIAPRWAARKVYEESLRKNIDPALIEKIWLNSYTLRVFPIPSKQDLKSQGRQLVEVKILTPILHNKEKIAYTPKFSFTNLKFDESSWIISKIYDNSVLIKEDIVKKDEIEKYLTHEHFMDFGARNDYSLWNMCVDQEIFSSLPIASNLISASWSQSTNKTSIFFDNSQSVERNKSHAYYEEIYASIKNFWNTLHDTDIYSFNFDVAKILAPNDIQFYGYSDIDRTIEFIINNKIVNQKIIIVTDDESFNLSTIENKTRNYASLITNQISIIKIGRKVKSYKQEFNNLLAATHGNIYEMNSPDDIERTVEKIYTMNTEKSLVMPICTTESYDENSKKILAWYIWSELLSNIHTEADWQDIAQIQTVVAQKYNIVNQFNSFIALETARQQQDLDRYAKDEKKYNSNYNNHEWWINNTPGSQAFFDNRTEILNSRTEIMKESSDSISRPSSMTFGARKTSSSIQWMVNNDYYSPKREITLFNGSTEFNFLWLLMFLVYLTEFYGFVAFVVNYVKWAKATHKV